MSVPSTAAFIWTVLFKPVPSADPTFVPYSHLTNFHAGLAVAVMISLGVTHLAVTEDPQDSVPAPAGDTEVVTV